MSGQLIDFAFSIEAGSWESEDRVASLLERVLPVAGAHLAEREGQPFPVDPVELSLLFTDDAAMSVLNGTWRGQEKPTNVLSFPAFPVAPGEMPGPMLGDIILARETIEREAGELGKPVDEHVTHLIVHGFLHLLGYDHLEEGDATRMEGIETRILAELDLSDPYGDSVPENE